MTAAFSLLAQSVTRTYTTDRDGACWPLQVASRSVPSSPSAPGLPSQETSAAVSAAAAEVAEQLAKEASSLLESTSASIPSVSDDMVLQSIDEMLAAASPSKPLAVAESYAQMHAAPATAALVSAAVETQTGQDRMSQGTQHSSNMPAEQHAGRQTASLPDAAQNRVQSVQTIPPSALLQSSAAGLQTSLFPHHQSPAALQVQWSQTMATAWLHVPMLHCSMTHAHD